MPAYQAVSVIGSVLLLAAYGGLQLGFLDTKSYAYQLGNLFGAACLTYSVIEPFNSGVLITEAAWTVFSVVGIWKIRSTRQSRQNAPDGADAARPATPK